MVTFNKLANSFLMRLFVCIIILLVVKQASSQSECTTTIYAPTHACVGQEVNFSSSCLGEVNNWYVNGYPAGTDASLSYTFSNPGTYTISFYFQTQGNCIQAWDPDSGTYITQCETLSDGTSITLNVYAPPQLPVVNASKTEICQPESVTFTVSNPQGGITYSWSSSPSGYSATGTQPTFNNISATTQFKVTASNASCSQVVSKNVTYHITSAQPILVSNTDYHQVQLGASTNPGSVYWQTSFNGESMSQILNGTLKVSEPGNYYLRKYSSVGSCWAVASQAVSITSFNNTTPPAAELILAYKHGYTESIFINENSNYFLTYADYFLVSSITGTEKTTPFKNGYRFLSPGTYYVRGQDKSTGTWGAATSYAVTLIDDREINSIYSKSFEGALHSDGVTPIILSESKAYFDEAGKPLQSQSKNQETNTVFASQNLQDRFDRVVGSTLSAPVASSSFRYREGFVVNESGEDYSHQDFDTNNTVHNPNKVGNTDEGTLGWYYSTRNTIEPSVAKTDFPYGRLEFYDDGLGSVRLSSAPGNQHKLGQGHEVFTATFPVITELDDYLVKRRLAGFSDNQSDNSLKYEGIQSVIRDENGKSSITLSDENGNVVMTARPGTVTQYDLQRTTQVNMSATAGAANYQPEFYFYLTHNQPINLMAESAINGMVYGDVIERNILNAGEAGFVAKQSIRLLPGFTTAGRSSFVSRISTASIGSFYVENMLTGERLALNQTFADGSGTWPSGFYKIIMVSGNVSFTYTNNYVDVSYLFYNTSGKLVNSISPNGYKAWSQGTSFSQIDKTTYSYKYNGLLESMNEPDAGLTRYIYRKDGSIRFSMNAEQATWSDGKFSYTNYDLHGRPIESGEYKVLSSTAVPDKLIFASDKMKSIIENINSDGGLLGGDKFDWLKSSYDVSDPNFNNETSLGSLLAQTNLRGAVSFGENVNSKTWYSYDELGRVTWVAQKVQGLSTATEKRVFVLNYTYDFLGNLVTASSQLYLNGQPVTGTKLTHHYDYDSNKRLDKVWTSTNGTDKKIRASYKYYAHGPLKRIILGDDVQGIDYLYNIQGWLTQINHPDVTQDPGGDGSNGVHRDVFGMILDYYESQMTNLFPSNLQPSYNGNISSVRWRTDEAYNTGLGEYKGMYLYQYDDKYQIKAANWAEPQYTTNSFVLAGNKYKLNNMNYDANGNILSLVRYDQNSSLTNNFTYAYAANKNQLLDVTGYTSNTNPSGHGFKYNLIGQMTDQDIASGDDQFVEYDVTGKVRKVYGPTAGQLKVEFLYDDKGFRVAKKNYVTNRHTWYIRDASGNIINTFEQNVATGSLVQTEISLYGAGKLGTLYPQQDGSAVYELNDHLGNVRALVRDNISVYTASLENNAQSGSSNPRNEELVYFQNIPETEVTDSRFNHTLANVVVPSPDKSSYLKWTNGITGQEAADKAIGPAIALKVNAGDTIRAEAWVRYERKVSYARNMNLAILSTVMGGTYTSVGGFEGSTLSQTTQSMQAGLSGAGFLTDNQTNRPYAYLNYLIFDQNKAYVNGGWVRIPENAGFDPGQEGLPNLHKQLKFVQPVIIPSNANNGYVYVWVSNESENTKVWFDDIQVTHSQIIGTQATDYGVWGEVLREQKTDESIYRYSYQGQFAEKDNETGWNHFELREYNPVIGRWSIVDPYRQYWSPYLGMGNDPINGIDQDGGLFGKLRAQLVAWWVGGDVWQDQSGNWRVSTAITLPDPDVPNGTIVQNVNIGNYGQSGLRGVQLKVPKPGTYINAWEPDVMQQWEMYDNFAANISYEAVDGIYVTSQFFTPWADKTHLDGQELVGKDKTDALGVTVSTLLPNTKLTYLKLTAPEFSVLFRGTLSRLSPAARGTANRIFNNQIVKKPIRNSKIVAGMVLDKND